MEPGSGGAAGGTPAPYGRACTNCARAKCRCIYRSGGTDCERCHRLRKECVPSVSVRKRNGRRAHVSRAAQLEAKLEDLVTLLRHQAATADKAPCPADTAGNTSANTPAMSARSITSRTEDSSPPSCAPAILPSQKPDSEPGRIRTWPPRDNLPPGSLCSGSRDTTSSVPSVDLPSIQPGPVEAEECLANFRKYMLIFLPFVHLPATMTAERLKVQYPFLWFNIMAITCKNADQRLAMTEAGKVRDKPILSLVASLANSLVFDLGLNKIPGEPYIAACLKISYLPAPKEKTLEEMRAVLACFLLTSQISHSMKRLDALTWTPHMDECLQTLSRQREWEGDDLLVAQVKVQLIIEQLTRATSQSPDGRPPSYVLSSLRTQLRSTKAQLPGHLQQNDTILSHISYAEVAIQEVAMAKPKSCFNGAMSDMERYEAMEASLSAAKEWFDRHFSIPSYVYVGMTFPYWWNMTHCLLTIHHLSILDDPAWDRQAVRNKCDPIALCDRLRLGFEEVAALRRMEVGPTEEDDTFAKFVKLTVLMKNSWARDLAVAEGNPKPGSAVPAEREPLIAGNIDGLNVPFFQPEDSDTWLAGFFDMNWDV
ncbi:hypothetical protein C8A03DRAFT_18416 [Achaetomium macrosporum]|uniref:Zn(2)-C6 fungal-type domain-containing protein n=1 Tax=Achaetomium macrosporum TaxID=79813 RepID=A0AAN7C3I8_9PEZI|nr:hypothetical protein C8A03DRAFT_18416 [Achaetomium macrosporum]